MVLFVIWFSMRLPTFLAATPPLLDDFDLPLLWLMASFQPPPLERIDYAEPDLFFRLPLIVSTPLMSLLLIRSWPPDRWTPNYAAVPWDTPLPRSLRILRTRWSFSHWVSLCLSISCLKFYGRIWVNFWEFGCPWSTAPLILRIVFKCFLYS